MILAGPSSIDPWRLYSNHFCMSKFRLPLSRLPWKENFILDDSSAITLLQINERN